MIEEIKKENIFFKKDYTKMFLMGACICLLICFLCVLSYILSDHPFAMRWDQHHQFSPFFEEFTYKITNLIKNKSMPFYSWVDFLGNNYWSSKLFFSISIFDYISLLFKNLRYDQIAAVQYVIKSIVSYSLFFIYAKYRKFKPRTALIASILFTFSSFAILGIYDFPLLHSFYVFIPLYFLLVELYFYDNKKYLFFPLLVCFLLITNYYSFYTLSLFTIFYFIYRYFQITGSLKNVIKKALPLIGLYLLGVLVSMFVTLPNFLHIIQNSRLGSSGQVLYFKDIKAYLGILTSLVAPPYISQELYAYGSQGTSIFTTLYAGSVIALLLPQSFKKKENKILFVGFLIVLLVPVFSSILQGFSEASFRWNQFLIFLNIVMVLETIDSLENVNIKHLKITLLIYLFIIFVTFVPTYNINIKEMFSTTINSKAYLFFLIIPFLVLMFVLIKKQKFKVILILTVIEIIVVNYYSLYDRRLNVKVDTITSVNEVLGKKDELTNFLDSKINDDIYFYRIYADDQKIYWDHCINQNIHYNFMGVNSYDSLIAPASNDINKIINQDWIFPWSKSIKDPNLLNMFDVEYAVVTNNEEIPFTNSEYYCEYNGFKIYKNLDCVKVAKSFGDIKTYEQYQKDGENTEDLTNYVLCNKEDYDEIKSYLSDAIISVNNAYKSDNGFNTEIDSNKNGFIVLSIQYDKGWKVLINGEESKYYKVNGGLMGLPIKSGTNIIEMYYTPPGLKTGVIISAAGILIYIVLVIKEVMKNKNNNTASKAK